MSPLWRDEVAIYVAPRKLALVRRARGLEPRVVAEAELTVLAGSSDGAGPVLSVLADVLAEPTWQGAAARVVVADHPWTRYGVVPSPPTRLDAAARLAHARCVLGDTYGEAVADWAVTLADTPPGRPCVASAMPATLRSALEDTLAPARLTLVSLQPQLIVAFNAWRRRLTGDDTWFVCVDDGSLSAVHVSRGAWDRVHMARLSPEWSVELDRLLALDRLTRPAGAQSRVVVDAPGWMRCGAAASAGIEWLEEGDGAHTHARALLQRVYA